MLDPLFDFGFYDYSKRLVTLYIDKEIYKKKTDK